MSKLIAGSVSLSVCWIGLSTAGVPTAPAYLLSAAVGLFFFYAVANEATYQRQQAGVLNPSVDLTAAMSGAVKKKTRAPAEEVIAAARLAYAHDEIELYHHEIAVEWALADGAAWAARSPVEEAFEEVSAQVTRASGVPVQLLGEPVPVRPDTAQPETYAKVYNAPSPHLEGMATKREWR